MSNQKCYSIDRCSIGESFDFSRAGSNDVSSNSITNSIVPCSVLSITIIISPQDQTVVAGGKIQFSAIVVNANDQKVKWSCSIGSIDDTGMFTAPYYADTVSITAESYSYPGVTSTSTTNVVIPDIEGNIGVKARGGTWSLGGYTSYDGSAPTRRWLRADTQYTVTYDCGGGQNTKTRSAVGVYDPANFAAGPTLSGGLLHGWDDGEYFCSRQETYAKSASTATATATPGVYISIGSCCGSDSPYTLVSGVQVNTLSSEYTDDDAIARLMTTNPEWTTGLTAIRTIPTTGITGLYRQIGYGTYVEQTINGVTTWVYTPLAGLLYTQTYHIVIFLQHRPVDSSGAPTGDGSWSNAGTAYSESFQPDVNGTGGVEWQIVEPEEGYETRIASWKAELI